MISIEPPCRRHEIKSPLSGSDCTNDSAIRGTLACCLTLAAAAAAAEEEVAKVLELLIKIALSCCCVVLPLISSGVYFVCYVEE